MDGKTHASSMDHASAPLVGRRDFLRRGATCALAVVGAGVVRPLHGAGLAEEGGDSGYGPFKMSVQSYTFRKFGFEKMAAAVGELGLKFVELYPDHFPIDLADSEFRSRMRILRHHSLRQIAYGVVDFAKDHQKNRAFFEFAKKVGLSSLSADPLPESFESLDKLVEEFKIPIAIHNHGPEDPRYRTPEMIAKALKDHHRLIGLCVDTGHFLMADVNPVEVVREFKDRVYGVHLKDVKSEGKQKRWSVLGEGDLKTADLLRALKDTGFKGGLSLEYEEEEDNPVPSVKKCLQVVRDAAKKLTA